MMPSPQLGGVEESQQTGDVVGHAVLGRRGGEHRVGGSDDQIAGEHRLAGAAPDAAFDHGDDRCVEGLDGTHQYAQRIAPAERVEPRRRQLVDVVSGRPHLGAGLGAQHDAAYAGRSERLQGRHESLDHLLAQGVALVGAVQRNGADVVGDGGEEHGSWQAVGERASAGLVECTRLADNKWRCGGGSRETYRSHPFAAPLALSAARSRLWA